MSDFINYLKNNLVLNGFTIAQTSYSTVIIFKSYRKYSKCIYLNFINGIIEVNIDKVFDSKEYYSSVERLIISRKIFYNTHESFNYIQKNVAI